MPATPPAATILDQTPDAALARLAAWAESKHLPKYRVAQIHRRLWLAPVGGWSEATELPSELRHELEGAFPLPRLDLATKEVSTDGTTKYLWRLADHEAIESVLIPTGSRRTLCISSQAGCALGCRFCATGRMGFRRNLTPFEIVGQVREIALVAAADRPTNIVFMGMGEPLLNWLAVDPALTILNHPAGFGIGARHITVSTVGIIPGMERLAKRPEQFRLAISLHSADPDTRLDLMPIEKKYHLAQVLEAAKAFGRRVTFEYVMIAGVNDQNEAADRLARLALGHRAHVNLLPLHPGGNPELAPSSNNRIHDFARRLRSAGVEAVVRRSRGLDISAACGQLYVATARPVGTT